MFTQHNTHAQSIRNTPLRIESFCALRHATRHAAHANRQALNARRDNAIIIIITINTITHYCASGNRITANIISCSIARNAHSLPFAPGSYVHNHVTAESVAYGNQVRHQYASRFQSIFNLINHLTPSSHCRQQFAFNHSQFDCQYCQPIIIIIAAIILTIRCARCLLYYGYI